MPSEKDRKTAGSAGSAEDIAGRAEGAAARSGGENTKAEKKDGKITDMTEWKKDHMDYIVRATACGGQIRAFAATTRSLVSRLERFIRPARYARRHSED